MRLLCPLFVSLLLTCRKKTPGPVAPGGKDFSALTDIMQTNLPQLGRQAGLVLLDKSGRVLYKQYFGGWSDQTYIPIASGSRLPSMAAIMTLVDEGKLSLNDPVSEFYPA